MDQIIPGFPAPGDGGSPMCSALSVVDGAYREYPSENATMFWFSPVPESG